MVTLIFGVVVLALILFAMQAFTSEMTWLTTCSSVTESTYALRRTVATKLSGITGR